MEVSNKEKIMSNIYDSADELSRVYESTRIQVCQAAKRCHQAEVNQPANFADICAVKEIQVLCAMKRRTKNELKTRCA